MAAKPAADGPTMAAMSVLRDARKPGVSKNDPLAM
jgi:hypothetical protein